MTLAKALGNGVPIGACLVAGAARDVLGPGSHGSTFGGNPLSCAAALAVIETVEEEQLLDRATAMGRRLHDKLEEGLQGLNCVTEVRSKGLMVGVELSRPCAELVQAALEAGLLINVTADNVVRLLPPLIISAEQVDELAGGVCALIREWNSGTDS
jgi:acetylornithine aminotransferase